MEELRDMDEEDLDAIGLKPFYRKRLVKMLAQVLISFFSITCAYFFLVAA